MTDYKLVPVEPTAEMIAALKARLKTTSRGGILNAGHALADAISAAPAVQGEPVGWHTEDHLDDKSATTYNAEVAQRWRDKGWPVWPLYTAPQPAEQPVNKESLTTAEPVAWIAASEQLLGARAQISEGGRAMNNRVCKHGQLGRTCPLCELEEELDEKTKTIAALERKMELEQSESTPAVQGEVNMMLVLIRGLPGSGKSTIARVLQQAGFEWVEADSYHLNAEGEYCYNPANVKAAHEWCQREVFKALSNGKSVVVSNTFTRRFEMEPYFEMAKTFGIEPNILEATGNWPNVHGVPAQVIERMRARWENVDGEAEK